MTRCFKVRTSVLSTASPLIMAGMLGAGQAILAAPAQAAPVAVSTDAELRTAIATAGPATSAIDVVDNITLLANLPKVTQDLTLSGGPANSQDPRALSGAGTYRGLKVSTGHLALQNIIISDMLAKPGDAGSDFDPVNPGRGGAVFVDAGASLTLTNVTLENNSAATSAVLGGGSNSGLGGAIYVQAGGSLSVMNSIVIQDNNVAAGTDSAGPCATGVCLGTGLYFDGNHTLTFDSDNADSRQFIGDGIADNFSVFGNAGVLAIVKDGPGKLILTGVNAYAGGTTVKAGALFGDTNGLVGNIVNNSAVVFDQEFIGTYAGRISGSGRVVKTSFGVVELTGANSWTGDTSIEDGILLIGPGGSLSGPGDVIAISNASFGATIDATITRDMVLGQGAGILVPASADGTLPTLTLAGNISGGPLVITGPGLVELTGSNSFAGIEIDGGGLSFKTEASLGKVAPIKAASGSYIIAGADAQNSLVLNGPFELRVDDIGVTWSGNISGDGPLTKTGTGLVVLTGENSYTGGTNIEAGTVRIIGDTLGAAGTGVTIADGATLELSGGTTVNRPVSSANGNLFVDFQNTEYLAGPITGTLNKKGLGTLILTSQNNGDAQLTLNDGVISVTSFSMPAGITLPGRNVESRSVVINQDVDGATSGSFAGSGFIFKQGSAFITLNSPSEMLPDSSRLGGLIINEGGVVLKAAFTGNVYVEKDGILAGSSEVNGEVILDGGRIVPGDNARFGNAALGSNPISTRRSSIGTLTINGSLTINSGTLEMAVSPTASDQINVIGPDGIITLGVHKLQLDFEPGLYGPRTYTLLSASQEIRGQIDTATAITPPANFTGRAFTTSKEVLLTLTADLGRDLTLSDNQSAVSNSLDSVYNASGVIAAGPAGLYGLTGPALGNALTATTGEVATGFHVATVRMNNRLLSMLLDPFIDGRTDFSAAGQPDSTEDRGWSGWAGAYAGFDNVNGNAVVGSQNLSDNTQGFVMGLDYRVSGSTVVGVAVGVGGTQWSLDGSFGTGSSLAIQAGAYASTTLGPVYLSGAFSFIQQWGSTDRNVLGERLTADPDAQSFGGRIEAGYRLETGFGAFTPYAAGQSQWFNSGDYGELSIAGNGFALDYAGQSTSDQRTELGFRFETRPKSSDARQLMFQARAAWAHDWPGERSMEAAFRSVPGSDFVVEGAQLSTNLALLSAGAQLNISKAVALQALFNAELGDNSTTLGGSLALSFAF